jgi:hypothetical protein
LRFPGFNLDEPWPSEGGVAGLDLAVEDDAREGEASDRWTCVDVVDATFEGREAGFFASGTLSRRIVGVARWMLNFLLLKRFIIKNVLKVGQERNKSAH